jgi:hypothetical protein
VLAVAAVLLAGAVALSVAPLSRPGTTTGSIACGAPLVAVGRPNPRIALEGLGQLGATRPAATAPSRQALLRLAQLERDLERYEACHRPAAERLMLANALTAAGVVLLAAWAFSARRRGAPRVPDARWAPA